MAETNNYNLYKPAAGESGWAQSLNTNFDVIDGQMKSNQDALSNHTGTGSNKHNADQIRTNNGSDVESEITSLKSGKADTNHSHSYAEINHLHNAEDIRMPDGSNVPHHISRIDSDILRIDNTMDLLLPDLSLIIITAEITNRPGGIRILCNATPVIHITNWMINIMKDGHTVCEFISSSSFIFIDDEALNGVNSGDILEIKIVVVSGKSSKSRTYSHTYNHQDTPLEERINQVESQLTIGNIIDAFAQDTDALQALANILHSSNTLAQKVADLSM